MTWSDGIGSKGSQQRPQTVSGSTWNPQRLQTNPSPNPNDSRWDLTRPQEFESAQHDDDVGGEEREPLERPVGGAPKGGTSMGVYVMD